MTLDEMEERHPLLLGFVTVIIHLLFWPFVLAVLVAPLFFAYDIGLRHGQGSAPNGLCLPGNNQVKDNRPPEDTLGSLPNDRKREVIIPSQAQTLGSGEGQI